MLTESVVTPSCTFEPWLTLPNVGNALAARPSPATRAASTARLTSSSVGVGHAWPEETVDPSRQVWVVGIGGVMDSSSPPPQAVSENTRQASTRPRPIRDRSMGFLSLDEQVRIPGAALGRRAIANISQGRERPHLFTKARGATPCRVPGSCIQRVARQSGIPEKCSQGAS